jgi:hypothetical protein
VPYRTLLKKLKMLTPWYITGFCDGEAAFTYSRAGGTLALYFSIKQKEDNKDIIEAIQTYFGYIGKIYTYKGASLGKNSSFTKPAAYYRVTKIEELKRVLEHFDKYPLQIKKKHEAYCVWREMVKHKLENFRNIDYAKLRMLAERLSSLNAQTRAFPHKVIKIDGGPA